VVDGVDGAAGGVGAAHAGKCTHVLWAREGKREKKKKGERVSNGKEVNERKKRA
jgi:hypothetical protein